MPHEENPELQVAARVMGIIRTPFAEPAGTPIQAVHGENIEGQVLLFEPYAAALDDIEGMSVVRLLRKKGSTLYIADIDIVDGTRLLDIKPYVPAFDSHLGCRAGWLDTARVDRGSADDRFHGPCTDAEENP